MNKSKQEKKFKKRTKKYIFKIRNNKINLKSILSIERIHKKSYYYYNNTVDN